MSHVLSGGALPALAIAAAAATASAYEPPVDRSGPVTLRIEGPAEVTQPGSMVIRLIAENQGDEPISGVLRVAVIDAWRIEPATAQAIRVEPGGSVERPLRVVVDPATYNAHYPIHAFGRFETAGGKTIEVHPILIVETNLTDPPRASPPPLPWKSAAAPRDGLLNLWQLETFLPMIEVFGRAARGLGIGFQGSEEESRASLRVQTIGLSGARRECLAMHPPWYDGHAGTIAVQYWLALPDAAPIQLRFATAVAEDHRGDGVTFRVRAIDAARPETEWGDVLFERHSASKTWEPGEADLSRLAGRTIRLQLESHPGAKGDTAFDQSYWAEPTLVVGRPAEPPPFPPSGDEGSTVLGWIGRDAAESAGEVPERYEVRIWPGRRGLLDAVVGFRRAGQTVCFRGFEARVAGCRLDQPGCPMLLQRCETEGGAGRLRVRHVFVGASVAFDLIGELAVEQGVLRARFRLDNAPPPRPWRAVHLEQVACGPWNRAARHVYAGHGNVVRDPEAFFLPFGGHRLASSMVGLDFAEAFSIVQGADVPPDGLDVRPAERHYSLHVPHQSTLTLIPCADVFEGVKLWRDVCGLKAASGVPRLAGRFVFDLWGGRYADSAAALERSFRYGLVDAVVVWHNWQRWGYDYRLPDIYPPNPQFGTFDEFRRLVEVCKRSGVLFAPHDNYIDFYPDADGFSYEKRIAFDAGRRPVKAWLNEHRGARSYRYRADAIEPFLTRNVRLMRDGFAPDAFFIDVWSSIAPYDYWTADGQFVDRVATRDTWGRHFAWIRGLLGGDAPQISESGHDQLIGYLDGAQTNHLRVGPPVPGYYSWSVWNWNCADAERIAWLDAAHHDRFILHGAGYPGRYEAGLDPKLHGIASDDYITTEVLTGHPGMVSAPFGRDVVRKYWLTQPLMRSLALRRIDAVELVGGDLHRQRVAWSGGGQVWVNRGREDWSVEGAVLPAFGFLARVPVEGGALEASISRRDGVIVEWSRWPAGLYVNGRRFAPGPRRIAIGAAEARSTGGRQFELPIEWRLDDPIPEGYRPFFHFVDPKGARDGIVFQAAADPAALPTGRTGTFTLTARATLPGDLPAGSVLELRAGLYAPAGGQRLELLGPDDGTRRVRVGVLRLEGERDGAAALNWQAIEARPDPLLARHNPEAKEIDFGGVATSGAVRLTPEAGGLLVVPLPMGDGEPEYAVRIVPSKLPWPLPEIDRIEPIAQNGRAGDRRAVMREGDAVVVTCRPGDFAYRLLGGADAASAANPTGAGDPATSESSPGAARSE